MTPAATGAVAVAPGGAGGGQAVVGPDGEPTRSGGQALRSTRLRARSSVCCRPGARRTHNASMRAPPSLLSRFVRLSGLAAALAACLAPPAPAAASAASAASAAPGPGLQLKPCRLPGVEYPAQCGSVRRPLDPGAPQGTQIDVHVAVLPALARHKLPDPVFFLAGGPGQSAIALAGALSGQWSRLNFRRDLVFVDQRGTGRSAGLHCPQPDPARPLAELADSQAARERLAQCRRTLAKLPHGDLRHYTTTVAMQDLDAVRRALGAERINLVGGSYGTRAGLEYMRQFPQAVRRAVLDGVAPPDMVLPLAFGVDTQAAFEALLGACEADPGCKTRHPALRAAWEQLLAGLPRRVSAPNPVTGADEPFVLTRDAALMLVRPALYVPALAAGLPHAISEAARGRLAPLVGLGEALGAPRRELRLAEGQHFSVICSEDEPRITLAAAAQARRATPFAEPNLATYGEACRDWPRGAVPPEFYTVGPASAATLLLSGGADPVTPARHGERVARALGGKARHVVVEQAGHGVLAIGCVRDAAVRFIQAEDDAAALAVPTDCAQAVPRPPAWSPPAPAVSGSER
jgi:pimeloyl-ACP methyl ester carboxylesterase